MPDNTLTQYRDCIHNIDAQIQHLDRVEDADEIEKLSSERVDLVMKAHALRMADEPVVDLAVADFEQRVAENRPYEDAIDIVELEKRMRAVTNNA